MTSPLRYAGGKTRARKVLEQIFQREFPNTKVLISPFVGGGSFELFMSTKEISVIANDLFEPLYKFWISLKQDSKKLQQQVLDELPMTKEKFLDMRKTIFDENTASKYYLINRSSFNGTTFCGGYSQQAASGRLTNNIISKLCKVDLSQFEFANLDFEEFLEKHPQIKNQTVFLDPPYYIKNYLYGRDGDLHQNFDHTRLRNLLKHRTDWLLCYNDCEYVRELYKNCRILEVQWSYGMNSNKKSNEIVILPPLTN